MKKMFSASKQDWVELDGNDFMDLASYIPFVQKVAPEHELSLPDAASGKAAFGHNWKQCHQGPLALETRLTNKTFMDIGAGTWNHVLRMGSFPLSRKPTCARYWPTFGNWIAYLNYVSRK
jgi:hypothetical protein